MSPDWPILGRGHEIDGFVEPMEWGRSHYTVIRMPRALVADANKLRTRRVEGELEGVEINLALTQAPVISDTFVYAGASLLRRMQLEPGDPVRGHLAPVDPDHVLTARDVEAALESAGAREAWDSLRPADRRRRLVPVDSAVNPATRGRRIHALVHALSDQIR